MCHPVDTPADQASACGRTFGTFGHLSYFFDEMTPSDIQITVTYVSRHFSEKDKCLNVLPYAEACSAHGRAFGTPGLVVGWQNDVKTR